MSSHFDSVSKDEVSQLIEALLDGKISDEQFGRLDHWISTNADARQLYFDYLQIHQDLPNLIARQEDATLRNVTEPGRTNYSAARSPRRKSFWRTKTAAVLAMALLVPIALFIGIYLGNSSSGSNAEVASVPGDEPIINKASGAFFTNLAHARFFGELPPQIGASPILKRDYVLIQGMVELGFPNGASAVIEGPAAFRVDGNDLLALDIGRCSVHAPPGAEGFRVETPEISIVDRGTRFSVDVSQNSETDIQVIEGAADLYRKPTRDSAAANVTGSPLRLQEKEAIRFAFVNQREAVPVPFDQARYQYGLPDRVISYEATTSAEGRAKLLTSVTVQRGQKVETIPVDKLINSKVTWFHASNYIGYLAGDEKLPSPRVSLAADRSLRTGVINIGGSRQPLTSDPIMTVDESRDDFGTPGMAIQFDRPVRNGPGADVVLFEIQLFMNPLEGDSFHVSPLRFEAGLHSHTIQTFDLTMESPESLQLDDLYFHTFEEPPRSLEQLESFPNTPLFQVSKRHAIVVGIDLSDLGYAEGALVDGLFLQDDLADEDFLDPVLIAGLPEVSQP
ncbi:FecR family protein [Blastopirellula sp. J2-11]|uniref:FecR family protein n=1 Tax=Blastopirellula sp. J2-11 TaxID=2943192 RepID=UPI0021C9897B|nr:FecR family protein [Blastopirellula sp. J2-11]UUO08723.1 FecR family protein [Blastopirellula sp. J2-11]